MPVRTPKLPLPQELIGVTKDSIDRLDEKVERCYSQDRYEHFETAVEKITDKYIGTDGGRDKVKKHAKEAAKEYLEEKGWKDKNFWVPNAVAIAAAIAAFIACLIAYYK